MNGKSAISKSIEAVAADPVVTEAGTNTDAAPDDGWGDSQVTNAPSNDDSWEVVQPTDVAPASASPVVESKPSTRPDGSRSWASMLKPVAKPAPPIVKQAAMPTPHLKEAASVPAAEAKPVAQVAPMEGAISEVVTGREPEPLASSTSPSMPTSVAPQIVPPSEDKLTHENLELVKDVSHPVSSDTVASNAGTEDARSPLGTPGHGLMVSQSSSLRPGLGGFATSAMKATHGGGRSASFQRKMKEQHEAVVMPGNHAVDRTAVQFGSLGLGGNSGELDGDEDREEPETRTQPPQHSPVAPRASLPAAPQATLPTSEAAPTPRPAPGLPSHPQHQPLEQAPLSQTETQSAAPTQMPYDQFNNRFGLPMSQVASNTGSSKTYEPFGQQISSQHQVENYGSQSQTPSQQPTAQSHLGGFSTSGNDYAAYYGTSAGRDAFNNYGGYGAYGQQSQQTPQEAGASQPRTYSAFGSSATDQASQYATSLGQQQQYQHQHGASHNRFGTGEALASGNTTPAPSTAQQQSHSQSHNQSHQNQSSAQQGYGGNYGAYANYYNHPQYPQYANQMGGHHQQSYGRERLPFDDARRYDDGGSFAQQQQSHQGYGGYGHQGYGNTPYASGAGANKQYGQHGYGVSPAQAGYDSQSATPTNANSYLGGRDATGPSGFSGGYGRTVSSGQTDSQQQQQQQQQQSSYGAGMSDMFSRGQPGYPGQQGQTQQSGAGGLDEASRGGYGDAAKGGPSPAPVQQRPDSATGLGAQHHAASGHQQQGGYAAGYGGAFGHYYGRGGNPAWGGNYGH